MSIVVFALIAQLVEQLPFKEKVAGSNPAGRTIIIYVKCLPYEALV
jgi:hypothetical protein